MGDRSIVYALTAVAIAAAAAGDADATVRTAAAPTKVGAAGQVTVTPFDSALGTLLQVNVTADYSASTPYTYTGFTPTAGNNHAVAGTAMLGGLLFDMGGTATAIDYGQGHGAFNVVASGSASWTAASDLARLTGSGTALSGGVNLFAAAPGQTGVGGQSSVAYKVSYTYDDATAVAAVPEPATWALMAGGFTLVGVALRSARRRRDAGVSGAPTAS